jgi:hypothetical protein
VINLKNKIIPTVAATLAIMLTIGFSAGAVSSATSNPQSNSSATSSAPQDKHTRGAHFGGDFVAYKALSELTGINVKDLSTKYPQKTAWQIAKTLNKLDDLKKIFLSTAKTTLDKLVAEGKISADDSSKIYADMQKRVAAIDGVNTVILGRPGFKPQLKKVN